MKNKQLALIVTLVSALFFALPASAKNRYIDVSGDGQIEAWPDFLTIHILISAEDRTASAAKSKVDHAMNTLLSITQGLHIPDESIEAARLTNQPVYDWVNNKRNLRGEKVSRNVEITLRNLENHTSLLHQLLQQENIHVQHSQSSFDDPAALSLEATNLALQQAKSKAESMVSTLGIRLGKVISINEQSQRFTPLRSEMRMLKSADSIEAAPAPMLLQKQTINGQVQVRFQLK